MNEQAVQNQRYHKAGMYYEWMRYLIVFVLGIAMLGGAWFGYRMYTTNKNAVAQRVFSEIFDEYERAMAGVDEAWSNLETAATFAYEQHANTVFGPYILALKSEAVSYRGDYEQALELINQVIEKTHNDPLHVYYQTKRAIMRLDSADQSLQEAGLNGLRAIAQDANNPDQDRARYYLGAYYRSQGDEEAARNTWQSLVQDAQSAATDDISSVWADFAALQLKNSSV